MPEVQNVGTTDYSQYQLPQYQEQVTYPQEINEMPEMYDPEVEQKKKASLGMLGATILGATMLAGGILIGKKLGSKGAEAVEKGAEVLKDSEALKNYEKCKAALTDIEQAVEENNKQGWLWRFKGAQKMKNTIMEKIKAVKDLLPKAETKAEKVEDAAKKAAEETNK